MNNVSISDYIRDKIKDLDIKIAGELDSTVRIKLINRRISLINQLQIVEGEERTMQDNPVLPKHYTDNSLQPIQVIEEWDLNFNLGNVIKYVFRAGKKKTELAETDLKKAIQYLEFELSRRKRNENN